MHIMLNPVPGPGLPRLHRAAAVIERAQNAVAAHYFGEHNAHNNNNQITRQVACTLLYNEIRSGRAHALTRAQVCVCVHLCVRASV